MTVQLKQVTMEISGNCWRRMFYRLDAIPETQTSL